jgi:hypothetical protein
MFLNLNPLDINCQRSRDAKDLLLGCITAFVKIRGQQRNRRCPLATHCIFFRSSFLSLPFGTLNGFKRTTDFERRFPSTTATAHGQGFAESPCA